MREYQKEKTTAMAAARATRTITNIFFSHFGLPASYFLNIPRYQSIWRIFEPLLVFVAE